MKITYERLNQIIEEEVVKFKRLNEALVRADIDTSSLDGAISLIKSAISNSKNIAELKSNVSAALGKI